VQGAAQQARWEDAFPPLCRFRLTPSALRRPSQPIDRPRTPLRTTASPPQSVIPPPRTERKSLEVPASWTWIDREYLHDASLRWVNVRIHWTRSQIPAWWRLTRQNYAQDLQISSRFGARSSFGVRGLLPVRGRGSRRTLPSTGQGQVSNFPLTRPSASMCARTVFKRSIQSFGERESRSPRLETQPTRWRVGFAAANRQQPQRSAGGPGRLHAPYAYALDGESVHSQTGAIDPHTAPRTRQP